MNGKHISKKAKRANVAVAVTIAMVLFLLAATILLIFFKAEKRQQDKIVELQNAGSVEKNTDTIDIPGYEALTFQAGSKTQSISLSNPPQNSCYFRISLLLEDGTILWSSDLIAPGYGSKEITLSKELKEGSYPNSVLRYECFSQDKELRPLNGAETKLTIIAR